MQQAISLGQLQGLHMMDVRPSVLTGHLYTYHSSTPQEIGAYPSHDCSGIVSDRCRDDE